MDSAASQMTSTAVNLNLTFLVNTLESFYWYQRTEDSCANETAVNVRLAPGEVVRGRVLVHPPAGEPLLTLAGG